MPKKPLILVLGLGHSGTTILDAALSVSPMVTGVGEAARMLDPSLTASGGNWARLRTGAMDEIICTCGEAVPNCPVWSKVTGDLAQGTVSSLFPILYDAVTEASPETRYVLDSTPGGRRYLDDLSGFDLRIIQITRDVRSWAASYSKRRDAPVWRGYLVWKRETERLSRSIEKRGLPCFKLGYEEFALRPEPMLQKLCDWLDIPYLASMLAPFANTNSHIIAGNASVKDEKLASQIRYDGSWMADDRGALISGLLYAAMAGQNRRLVYSNGVVRRKN